MNVNFAIEELLPESSKRDCNGDTFVIGELLPESPKRVDDCNYDYEKCDFMFPTENKDIPKVIIEKFRLKNNELVEREAELRTLIIDCNKKIAAYNKKIIESRSVSNPSDDVSEFFREINDFKNKIFQYDKDIDRFNDDLSDFSINKVRLVALYGKRPDFDILANKILKNNMFKKLTKQ